MLDSPAVNAEDPAPSSPDDNRLVVVTLNVLNDLATWNARSSLIVDGLRATCADVIALQEIDLRSDTAPWLADALGGEFAVVAGIGGDRTQQDQFHDAVLDQMPTGIAASRTRGSPRTNTPCGKYA